MFLFGFSSPQKQEIQRSLPTDRGHFRRAQTQDYLSTQIQERGPNSHRMGLMNSKKKFRRKQLSEPEIDQIVESQAEDDAAWQKPIKVRRAKLTSLSLPADLAARAAFLARLHGEKNVDEWLARIIKERLELEEVAFGKAKREMSLRNGT